MIWSSHRGELDEICPSYYYEVFICEFSWNEVVTLGIGVVLHDPVKLKNSFVVRLNWYKEYI